MLITYACHADIPVTIEGCITFDNAFDSRQVVADREGHAVLWPKRERIDPNGNDINERGQLSMIPLYTLLRLYADGPVLSGCIDTHAMCEGDFRGTSTDNASLFRLRRAYSEFDWGDLQLRVGKDWHPMSPPDCMPNVVTYDEGEPPDPQVRVPQIRVAYQSDPAYRTSSHELIAMAASHTAGSLMLGFQDDGQPGVRRSSDFIRWSVVPNIHCQYRHIWDDYLCGVGIDYTRVLPRLETDLGYQEYESINSINVVAYASFEFPRWSMRNKVLFTQNATAYNLPHGFGVRSRDTDTGRQTYTNMRALAYWIDIDGMTDRELQPGLFAGIHTALGTEDPLFRDDDDHVTLVAQEPDLDLLMKVAPRIWYYHEPVHVGVEVEVSYAKFAEPEAPQAGERKFDTFGRALRTSDVTNIRSIANVYYYF